MSCAVALANIDLIEREDLLGNVLRNEDGFDAVMDRVAELPMVGEVRGCGYFRVAELVKDEATRTTFDDEECEWLLRGVLSHAVQGRTVLSCRRPGRSGRCPLPAIDVWPERAELHW